MGRLHPHRLAGDLHVLVAEIELEGLARRKHQRHECHPDVAGRRLGLDAEGPGHGLRRPTLAQHAPNHLGSTGGRRAG
jgi:hypothetical protein